jgi:hypothetical protein
MKLASTSDAKRISLARFSPPAQLSKLIAVGLLLFCASLTCWGQSRWRTEVIDNGSGDDVGKYSTLVVDQQGNFHVSYYDETRLALWYAFRASGDNRWFKMIVQPKGVGAFSSLAVDAQGRPHFSYISPREDGLHYAFWNGKIWEKEVIDPTQADYFNSISLDSQGHPRISYYQYHSAAGHNVLHLKYAFFDGRQWYIQTVDPRMSTGKFNSITVDDKGNPHIAYAHVGLGDLLYAYWDGSSWQISDVDSRRTHNDYVGEGNSIALDHNGRPGIAYFDVTKEIVKYVSWDGKAWKAEAVNQLSVRGELDRVSLKFDSHNRPYIAFYDAGQGALKLATKDDSGWHVEIVDRDGNVGFTPSLFLDDHDNPYITYYDLVRHALKFAYEDSGTRRPAVAANR